MVDTSDILFFDLEVHKKTGHILDIGAIFQGDQFRKKSVQRFEEFAKNASLVCGHNIMDHDLQVLKKHLDCEHFFTKPAIDTLYWSAILFPKKPYHQLVKDYHLDGDELNNPFGRRQAYSKVTHRFIECISSAPRRSESCILLFTKNSPRF
jgi:ATP-dependent DNA helicase RecQ